MKDFTKKLQSVAGIAVRAAVILALVTLNPFGSFSPNVSANDDDNGSRPRADFALLNMEPVPLAPSLGPDVSAQCGAIQGSSSRPKRTAFTMFITMTNRSDLGGVNGFVRVTYQDTDFVDYVIPVNTTLQISLAGGGTPGVDQGIKVTGTGGAVLVGQVSLITDRGKPNPVIDPTKTSFCNTTTFGNASPF